MPSIGQLHNKSNVSVGWMIICPSTQTHFYTFTALIIEYHWSHTAQLVILLFVHCWTQYLSGCARFLVVLLEATAWVFKTPSSVLHEGLNAAVCDFVSISTQTNSWAPYCRFGRERSKSELSVTVFLMVKVLNVAAQLYYVNRNRSWTGPYTPSTHTLTLKDPQLAWCLCLWTVGGN